MKPKRISLVALSILVVGFSPLSPFMRLLFAEEIVVSGNGSGASSEVSVTQQAATNVQQTNQAEVTNNVTTNADTGNNSASGNNGDVGVQTGNISTETQITNQANTSIVDSNSCCNNAQGTIVVSGNGADSTNTVSLTNTTTISTTTNQTATITNNIKGSAVTGNNKANDNQGDVTIITGNISHKELIGTGPVNTALVSFGIPDPSYKVKVDGNGAGSVNTVNLNTRNDVINTIYNTTNIFNDSFWNLITGNNIANRNNGDVVIKTGDIESTVTVVNKANISLIKEDCCKVKPTEPPTPTPPAPTPTQTNPKPEDGKGCGSCTSGGSSNNPPGSSTPASGSVLPATGGSWAVLLLIGNIIMLFFGVLLRLRSGRSPGFTYNFVV